jgi:hypothetical protein
MSTVVRHDLDFYSKPGSSGPLHEIMLWEAFSNGARRLVESGYGADDVEALGDLLNRLMESGHSERTIRTVREQYARARSQV